MGWAGPGLVLILVGGGGALTERRAEGWQALVPSRGPLVPTRLHVSPPSAGSDAIGG